MQSRLLIAVLSFEWNDNLPFYTFVIPVIGCIRILALPALLKCQLASADAWNRDMMTQFLLAVLTKLADHSAERGDIFQ
jgi:hypothetical protein